MKLRTALPFLALLIGPIASQAQRPSRSGLGYMGGPQAATWRSEAVNYRPVPGAVAGIYVPIWAGNRVEIQPELLLSLQGAARDLPDGERSTMRSLHATVPVSLKIFLNRTINLQAGVQGSYLLLAKTEGKDITDELSPLDMGLNVGIGLGTNNGVDFTLRYFSGLSNTLAEDHTTYPSNRTLQFTVGYRFMQFARGRQRN